MAVIEKYVSGTFCWAELGTTDPRAAKSFYGNLFGWSAVDTPMGPDMVYTMLQIEGKEAAALYGLMKDQLSQGVPPHWQLYVSVEDADAVAARAKELGGNVLAGPGEVPHAGRFAILQDPQGAVFGIWQPGAHIGARVGQVNGTVCWSELMTSDTSAASHFYTRLFGWNASDSGMPGMDYTIFKASETMAGGMMQLTEEMKGVPPHWMVYFQVADCDATVEKAKTSGGGLDFGPMEIPMVGRFAVLHDGQQAHFSILQPQQPQG